MTLLGDIWIPHPYPMINFVTFVLSDVSTALMTRCNFAVGRPIAL
jgi:hypothetical protein